MRPRSSSRGRNTSASVRVTVTVTAVRPLTHISRDAISLCLIDEFQQNVRITKNVFKVRDQGHRETKYTLAAEAYISTVWRRGLLFYFDVM